MNSLAGADVTVLESYEVGMERFVHEDRTSLRDFLSLDVPGSARPYPPRVDGGPRRR